MNWLAYQKAKDEGKNLRAWWKGEGTIGVAYSGAITYSHRLVFDSGYNRVSGNDTVIRGTAKPKIGLHINENSNHLLARLSDNSILSFSIGLQVDYTRYEERVDFASDGKRTEPLPMSYFQGGFPITLDYKWGADVDFNPDLKACFAVGAGVIPLLGIAFQDDSPLAGGTRTAPYFYASGGFYAAGCWKLRASFIPGSFVSYKDTYDEGYLADVKHTTSIEGKNIFSLGISYMTFSNDWRDGTASRGGGLGGKKGGSATGRRSRRHGGTRRMF